MHKSPGSVSPSQPSSSAIAVKFQPAATAPSAVLHLVQPSTPTSPLPPRVLVTLLDCPFQPMASIVLLLSELLGGESASVLAAERYMGGHRSLGEFRPAVTEAPAANRGQRLVEDQHAAAGTEPVRVREEDKKRKDPESFEDIAVSRIAVDGIMWP